MSPPESYLAQPRHSLSFDNILDVTLRDGGYLNQWQFPRTEIDATLNYLSENGIRRAEVGFLRPASASTSLVNGCSTDFLRQLSHNHPSMGMVAMLDPAEPNWREAIDGKLPYLSLIRLTCTAKLIDKALMIAESVRQAADPPEVSINLISISSYTQVEVTSLVKRIEQSHAVTYLYFADSRGAMLPHEIGPLISLASSHSRHALGFHAHDTRGHAIENSLAAHAHGCKMLDVSLNGFGLVGGNTSFAEFLITAGLADASLLSRTQAFGRHGLSLCHKGNSERSLYRALAAKNIDPIWSDELHERWQPQLMKLLQRLPRKTYKTLEEVSQALEENNATELASNDFEYSRDAANVPTETALLPSERHAAKQ